MPEDIKKILKIRKQSYKFELRRKFSNRKKFRVIKKSPLEILRQELKNKLFPKKPPGAPRIRGNPFIILGFLVLIIAFIVALMQSPGVEQPVVQPKNFAAAPPYLSIGLNESGVASIGGHVKELRAAYYKLAYTVGNTESVSVKTSIYDGRVPNQVFMLSSKRIQATAYSQFRYSLRKYLAEKGFPLNEISLEQIETLPEGAVLVVPSGLIPEKMVQPGGAHLMSLLDRGVAVLYIGQKLDQAMTESGSNRKITEDELKKLPFSFETASLSSNGTLHLGSTLYKVRSSRSGGDLGLLYGMISAGGISRGTMIFVPQTLDGGWGSRYDDAAEDIAKIIVETKWLAPEAEQEVKTEVNGNASVYSLFSSPRFAEREKALIVRVTASNPNSSTGKMKVLYPKADANGDLYFLTLSHEREDATRLVSGKITGEDIQFITNLRENTSIERSLYITMTNVSGAEVQQRHTISPGAGGKVPLSGSTQFSERLRLDKGFYLASIIDDSGNPYARALIEITDVDFKAAGTDFARGIFNFTAESDGQPVRVRGGKISVDGMYNTTFPDATGIGVSIENRLGGQPLAAGNHTFDFEIGEFKKRITLANPVSKQFWENPLIWVLFLISIALFGGTPFLAVLMKKEEYSLDVPDFPPLASIKIPLTKDAVLGVIEKINDDYRWKSTPLRLEEIKKGFKKIIYQGKPVFISDYNLEYILEGLRNKGEIKEALGYYGLAKWEKDSGRAMTYLSMQRKIRDICINEAIPFSRTGESKECDIRLQVLGQDVFVYIIDSVSVREDKLSSSLRMMQKGLSVLLFENMEAKKDFEDTISSSSESSGLVKMEIMSGSLVPLTMNELEKMLKEMKNI